MSSSFTPRVFLHGVEYRLTGIDWLIVFALAGFKWAEDELEKLNLPYRSFDPSI